jgi:gamma-glutamyltranspeptidase/glutathione hydrolase
VLSNGGNAFDAAAATAATLNVVEPYMSGLAGQGMATCYIASEKRVRSLNFISRIPRKFPLEKLSDRAQVLRGPIASDRRTISPAGAGWSAPTAPGSCRLFAPAIGIARDSFSLIGQRRGDHGVTRSCAAGQAIPNGRAPLPGHWWQPAGAGRSAEAPDLAKTGGTGGRGLA